MPPQGKSDGNRVPSHLVPKESTTTAVIKARMLRTKNDP
jgi:hypothetical protein